jgi:hypothetical protein
MVDDGLVQIQQRAEPEFKADDESWPLPWECTQQ